MELQRRTVAIIAFFLFYCLLLLHYRRQSHSDKEIDIVTFEFTHFDNSLQKEGKEFWDSIQPRFQCPPDQLARVGNTGDGGKWTCGLVHLGWFSQQQPDYKCLVYSFGVNGDSTFEAEVLKNTRCSVYAYDPTVNQIARPLSSKNPRVYFQKMGIGGDDKGNLKSLSTMMQENGGHEWIDIVKMDVEGSEYLSLKRIMNDFEDIPFGQLLLEFHVGDSASSQRADVITTIRNLEERGFRLFYKEVNPFYPKTCSEFSFINTGALDRFIDEGAFRQLIATGKQ